MRQGDSQALSCIAAFSCDRAQEELEDDVEALTRAGRSWPGCVAQCWEALQHVKGRRSETGPQYATAISQLHRTPVFYVTGFDYYVYSDLLYCTLLPGTHLVDLLQLMPHRARGARTTWRVDLGAQWHGRFCGCIPVL